MKKVRIILFFTFLFSLFNFLGKAQITINQSDVWSIGAAIINANDTIPVVTSGGAGPSQTWNFSAIADRYTDTLFGVTPSSTPYFTNYSSDFPSSNLAWHSNEQHSLFETNYYTLSPDSLTSEALFGKQGTNLTITTLYPAFKLMPFPTNYPNTWSTTCRSVAKIPAGAGDTTEVIRMQTYSITVDGWGTVTTPSGTYNALRFNTITIPVYDSSLIFISNSWLLLSYTTGGIKMDDFTWWANGMGSWVAFIHYDTLGGHPTFAEYLKKSILTGADEMSVNLNAGVYPNPASSILNIMLKSPSDGGQVEISDITGRKIENSPFGSGIIKVNTTGYSNGLYLYILTDSAGNLIDRGKFIVYH